MKSLRILLLVAAFATLSSVVASAHSVSPRVDRREMRQHHRIVQGVRSGEITRGEARHLRAGQMRVHRMECRAKADGVMTRRERARIGYAQNVQSRHIARLGHNNRSR